MQQSHWRHILLTKTSFDEVPTAAPVVATKGVGELLSLFGQPPTEGSLPLTSILLVSGLRSQLLEEYDAHADLIVGHGEPRGKHTLCSIGERTRDYVMRYPELDTADKARSVAILNLLTEQNLLVQIVGDSLELKPGDLSGEFLALEIARGLHRVLHDRTKPREMFSTLARKGKSPVVQAVASVQLSASLLRDRIEDEMIDEHFALAASAIDRVHERFLRELLLSRTLRARALAEFRHVELRKRVFDDGAALVQALAFGEKAAKVAASSYERHLAEENLKIVWESTLKASIALNHAELFERSFETLKKMDPNDPSLYVLAARAGSSLLPWDARLRLLRKGAGLGSPLAARARELVAEHEVRS